MSIAIIATLLFVGAAKAVDATTYYVSNSGSDGNSGTSSSSPWLTAAKVNGFTFQPGDQVLFQAGGVWHENLNPNGGDGAAGNPITFSSYGSGAKPMFSGSITLPNSGFTNVGGTVWQYNTTSPIGAVYYNKVSLIPANPNANQPVSSIPGSFYWNGSNVQINVSTNPNTDGSLIEGAVREDIIANGNGTSYFGHSHLVFTNLQEEESGDINDNNGGYGFRIQNGTDVTLNNIDSYRCGKHNFGVINSTQVTLNGCTAQYPLPNQDSTGGYSAYVSYGDNSTNLPNQTSVYNNCKGDHMEDTYTGQYEDTSYEFFTCHGSNLGSVQLNNCDAYSSSAGGAGAHWTLNNQDSQQAGHPATISITGGYQQNNQLYLQGTGLLVNGLTMSGPGATSTNDATATIDMECTNSTVENTLMYELNVGYWLYSADIKDGGTGNTIRFNTIVNDPNSSDPCIDNQDNSSSIYGNLFVNSGAGISGNTPGYSAYNLQETSISAAGFVNASGGNYGITSSSPARDYVPLSVSYPATDLTGTARPDGSANDAGAYQYGSAGGNSTPVITSSTSASGTVGTAFSYQITATNSPTSFSETGTLPAGLTLNTSSGVISGTPSASGTSTVTIKATNSTGTGSGSLTITISAAGSKPVISSSLSASGTAGSAFTYTITATNSPTSFGATNLPAGLSVNTSTGVISGTPSAAGTTSVTISASNSYGTGSATLTLTIGSSGAQVPYVTSSGVAGVTVNLPFSYQITATNTPTSFGASGLAPGLSVNTSTGLISGTPTTVGTYTATVSATNSGGTGSTTLKIYITAVTAEAPYGGTAASIPGLIYADNYDVGGEGVAFHDTDSENIGGQYRTDGVDIYTTTDSSPTNGYDIGYIQTGEYLKYTSNVTSSGTYTVAVRVQTGNYSGQTMHVDVDGTNVTGALAVPNTGYSSWATVSATGISISAGSHIIEAYFDAPNIGLNWIQFTLTSGGSAPVITSASTATGTVGTAFSYQITATNSPTSYSETGTLPAGLSLNTSSGVISGTPTASGTSTVTIGATNATGTGTASLAITINSSVSKPVITSSTTASGNVGTAFTYQITATNSPTSYTETGTLPAGLSFSTSTGKITGTPTATGTTTVTIGATNSAGTGTASLAITINPAKPVITSSGTATGTVGAAFSYQITASNSPTSYSVTGTLPAGLSVNTSTGVISGTPSAAGTSTVTINATNAGGTGSASLAITINPAAPVVTSSTSASGTTGTAFSYQITATNSPTSYSETGTLPAGLSLNTSTGVISGTPTTAGSTTVTIKATNSGGTGSASLTITITAASTHLTGSLGPAPTGTVNLTTEGTTDWGHWGSEGSGNWDHKASGGVIGWTAVATPFTYGGDPESFLWTDGGQNWNGQAQSTGFYFNGGGGTAGFSITAPADLTTRTLKFYVGSFGGTGTLAASLSDGSSPAYTNTSLTPNTEGVYTIVYSAASAGQTLTVNWYDPSGGRLTVQSVSLH